MKSRFVVFATKTGLSPLGKSEKRNPGDRQAAKDAAAGRSAGGASGSRSSGT